MHNTVAGAKLLKMSHSEGVDTVISCLASLCMRFSFRVQNLGGERLNESHKCDLLKFVASSLMHVAPFLIWQLIWLR